MAKMRYHMHTEYVTVPAAGIPVIRRTDVLRDVVPDMPFKIHGIDWLVGANGNTGGLTILTILKNILQPQPAATDVWVRQAGFLLFKELVKTLGDNTWEFIQDTIILKEPLDFDRNDRLGYELQRPASDAAGAERFMELYLGFWYTVGK